MQNIIQSIPKTEKFLIIKLTNVLYNIITIRNKENIQNNILFVFLIFHFFYLKCQNLTLIQFMQLQMLLD